MNSEMKRRNFADINDAKQLLREVEKIAAQLESVAESLEANYDDRDSGQSALKSIDWAIRYTEEAGSFLEFYMEYLADMTDPSYY